MNVTPEEVREAFRLGGDAFLNNKPITANPYWLLRQQREYNAWANGYREIEKEWNEHSSHYHTAEDF